MINIQSMADSQKPQLNQKRLELAFCGCQHQRLKEEKLMHREVLNLPPSKLEYPHENVGKHPSLGLPI